MSVQDLRIGRAWISRATSYDAPLVRLAFPQSLPHRDVIPPFPGLGMAPFFPMEIRLVCRYFDALEEVAAVREAEAKGHFMPDWVPFSASDECQLCKADFSWASTSRSEVLCLPPMFRVVPAIESLVHSLRCCSEWMAWLLKNWGGGEGGGNDPDGGSQALMCCFFFLFFLSSVGVSLASSVASGMRRLNDSAISTTVVCAGSWCATLARGTARHSLGLASWSLRGSAIVASTELTRQN